MFFFLSNHQYLKNNSNMFVLVTDKAHKIPLGGQARIYIDCWENDSL